MKIWTPLGQNEVSSIQGLSFETKGFLLSMSVDECSAVQLVHGNSSYSSSLSSIMQQAECSFTSDGIGARISEFVQLKRGSEYELKAAVASKGPIAVSVDASNKAFIVSLQHQQKDLSTLSLSHTHFLSPIYSTTTVESTPHLYVPSISQTTLWQWQAMIPTIQLTTGLSRTGNSLQNQSLVIAVLLTFPISVLQLGNKLGKEGIHLNVQKLLQPVWNCF